MIIICDSSPLIALAICNKLAILEKLYGKVVVPRAVYNEIVVRSKPNALELIEWTRDKVVDINDDDLADAINVVLDRGESEAIALYKELNADVLLIDEKAGREYAEGYGVKIIGTLGVLLKAKQSGLVKEIKSDISILKQSTIRISDELYERILGLAGEIGGSNG
ncbi:MAG: DUF3368 domain-containing protein [Spirochaetaceae bacterium]|jgi:predicted nucleic acid-binding protein|nr:DUF3368 domain-containing protein [Spirochaetaceae bacterium]